ncbi:MAG: hypothetical protein V1808_02230 [Candidatus Daviesbacteria bacterium]
MNKLSLKLPGFEGTIAPPPGFKTEYTDIGSTLTGAFNILIFIPIFLCFFWVIWGVFHYIFAGGDKEQLRKARSRITWAVVGLILTLLAFALAQFVEQILQPGTNPGFKSPLSFVTPAYAATLDLGEQYGFGKIKTLGEGVNLLVEPAFAIATTAVVIYLIVGGVRFLTSGGDKENISKARNTITHALIGFLLLMVTFLFFQFFFEFFGLKGMEIIK